MAVSILASSKYPDEELTFGIDWTAQLGGSSVIGTPTATGVGLTVADIFQDGNVTTLKVSGGTAVNKTSHVQLLATTSAGEKLGVNLLVPISAR